jgi:hypothetical protein
VSAGRQPNESSEGQSVIHDTRPEWFGFANQHERGTSMRNLLIAIAFIGLVAVNGCADNSKPAQELKGAARHEQ